ncbi:Uncharacterized mitochondrial protein AtMg00820 [Striga hermonthica]|uniref:Uncharacterized mitochondrial protein AtMg00820 n=1 Tax=Striga hermonthica TaxID=68872 RepID=A0A9N7RFG3_STRHE|nr:Uncharacterized mitochondrial protein AtMg00820 [Striga hermonthica]
MAAEGSIPSIPLSTMIHMGFLLHLDGSSPCPSREITTPAGTKSTNPDFTTWYSRDQLIRLFLVSTLTEESMAVVISCTSSRDVWTSLTRAYSHASKARERSMKDDLLSVKRGDLSVSEYGQRFKAICDKLAAIGRSIDSTDKSHWFLRSLRPAFSTFTAAQLAQEPLPDFDTLLARAESHQFFQRSSDISPSSSSVAFYAAPKARPPTSSQPQGRFKKNKGKGPRPPWCYFCREENHDAWDCPRHFDRSFTRPSRSSTTANLAEALSSSCSISQLNVSDWYLDTGASAHITSDASQLDDLTDYNGSDRVTVDTGPLFPSPAPPQAHSACRICASSDLVQPSVVPPLTPPVPNPTDDLPHKQPVDAQLGLQPDTTPRAPPAAPRAPPAATHPMQTRAKSGIFKPRYPATINCASLLTALTAISEPRGITAALKSPQWVRAMLKELSALKANNTWSLVPRPSSTNVVGSRWVFRTNFLLMVLLIGIKLAWLLKGLAKFLDSKPVATPLAPGSSMTKHGDPLDKPPLYPSLVGALQYLTITRPDIAYSVNTVSQFQQHPTIDHF